MGSEMFKKIVYLLIILGVFVRFSYSMDLIEEKQVIDLCPYQFEWGELMTLKEAQPLCKDYKGFNIRIEIVDATKLNESLPASWRVFSNQSFLSRISKIKEHVVGDSPDSFETISNYEIGKDVLGYGPYFFDLKCTATPMPIEDDFVMVGSEDKDAGSGCIDLSQLKNYETTELPSVINVGQSSEYYNLRAIRNIPQLAQGYRIHPSVLRRKMVSFLSGGKDWKDSKESYSPGQEEKSVYRFVQKEANITAVFSPAHDLLPGFTLMDSINNGGLPLKETFEVLNKSEIFNQGGTVRAFIPIAQSNGWRKHWTLLVLDKNESGIWNARHLDSKGFISARYKLNIILDELKLMNCMYLEYNYLGHQGVINNTDCGLFVTQYIKFFLEGIDPKELPTPEVVKNFKFLSDI